MRHRIRIILALFLCSTFTSVATEDNDDNSFTIGDNSQYEDLGFDSDESNEDDNTSTWIRNVSNRDSLRQVKVYDLNGRRVMSITKKGIYIINGKKVVVR